MAEDNEAGPMYGIVANVLTDKALRSGAKVWILYCNGDAENPVVRGLSKSGRPIEKYTKYARLYNFRAAWIPPNLRKDVGWSWEKKDEAEQRAAALAEIWGGPFPNWPYK